MLEALIFVCQTVINLFIIVMAIRYWCGHWRIVWKNKEVTDERM